MFLISIFNLLMRSIFPEPLWGYHCFNGLNPFHKHFDEANKIKLLHLVSGLIAVITVEPAVQFPFV